MKKLFFAFLAAIIVFSSCTKTIVEPLYEVRLQFQYSGDKWTNDPNFITLPTYTHFIDFDKKDYPNMDSITLNASLRTDALTDTVYVRLFNVTDNVEIANSTLSASTKNNIETKQVHTNNLASAIPNKKITLAIQVKGIGMGYVSPPFLKLRRN
jgi:hypothetical protein